MSDKEKYVKKGEEDIQEVVGTEIDYLSNGDYQEYNGNSEVGTADKIDLKNTDGHQITTDEFGNFVAPRGYFGSRNAYTYGIRESFIKAIGSDPKLYESVKQHIIEKIQEKILDRMKIK